jgi:hypothetical protein
LSSNPDENPPKQEVFPWYCRRKPNPLAPLLAYILYVQHSNGQGSASITFQTYLQRAPPRTRCPQATLALSGTSLVDRVASGVRKLVARPKGQHYSPRPSLVAASISISKRAKLDKGGVQIRFCTVLALSPLHCHNLKGVG